MTCEVDSVSATLNERVAEVERVVQTRSTLPATTVEQNPTFHEDIPRLDARIEAGFQTSRVVDELREDMSQSIDRRLTHVNTQIRGLREFATAVEKFVHQKFSPQASGAAAPDSSPSQVHVGLAVPVG